MTPQTSFFDASIFDTSKLEKKPLKAGDLVFREGDAARAIYVVDEGRIQLIRYTPEGSPAILHTAISGGSFAEAALFSDRYHCHALAAETSVVTAFPKAHVLETLRTNTEKMERYVALLSRQVRDLRTLLELRSIRSARERILQFLYLRLGKENRIIKFHSALKDVATELGLTHETFYRQIAALEREGLIRREGRSIELLRF